MHCLPGAWNTHTRSTCKTPCPILPSPSSPKIPQLAGAILLVFANKQDQKGALNAQQISEGMGLPDVRGRQWSIQETSALKGKGLFEGFDWLVTCIKGAQEG